MVVSNSAEVDFPPGINKPPKVECNMQGLGMALSNMWHSSDKNTLNPGHCLFNFFYLWVQAPAALSEIR